MPRVFVPGPNVRLNAASPASFIENIQKLLARPGERRVAQEKVDATKLFREQTLAQETRKQDFAEGASGRARTEEQFIFDKTKERNSAIAKSQLAAVQGTGNSGIQSFIDNPEAQKVFKDLGFDNSEIILAKVKELAGDDKTIFSDPKIWGQAAYEKIITEGGSIAQADAARARVQTKFSSMPKEFATKLFRTSASGSGIFSKLFGTGKGSVGAGKAIQSAPSQKDEEELRQILTGNMGVEKTRGDGVVDAVMAFVGWGDPTRSVWDFGNRDLDQGDIERLVGTFGDRFPQHAIVGALRSIINPDDGTFDQEKWLDIINDPNSDSSKDFILEIKKWQKTAERTRGGKLLANLSAEEIFDLGDAIQKADNAFNLDLINRTIPGPQSFEERLAAFSSKFGPQQNGQAGQAGPGNILPGAPPGIAGLTDPAGQGNAGGAVNDVSTGSVGLDSLLAEVAADPGPGSRTNIFNSPQGRDQQNLLPGNLIDSVAARSGIENSVVGGNGPTFQQLETQQKIGEITKTLKELPPSIAQSLAQKNAKPKLEKELQALQTGVTLPSTESSLANNEFETAKVREAQESSDDEESNRINTRIQNMSKIERKTLLDQGKKALESGEITISDLAGMRGKHEDKLIELIIRRTQ